MCLLAGEVLEQRADGYAVYPLPAPARVQFGRRQSPHFLGVMLEEHVVQRSPETVDVEVLERGLGPFEHVGVHPAGSGIRAPEQAQVEEGLHVECDRIGEELPVVEDMREPVAQQHDAVFPFGVRPVRRECLGVRAGEVVCRRLPLDGQQVCSPFHDGGVFGEEAVPSDVYAVSVVFHRA